VLIFLCGAQISYAQFQTTAEPKLTQIKLKNYGWQPPQPPHRGEFASRSQPLTIDHQGRILVGFTIRDQAIGLTTRELPTLSYHIVRFAPDGKLDLSLTLPTNNWRQNGVYLDKADDLIARANDTLQMLASGEQGGGHDWESLESCGPRCEIQQSFSRGTLLLVNMDSRPPVTILQETPPRVVRRCERPKLPNDHLTDTFFYFVKGGPIGPAPMLYRWPLCDFAQHTEMQAATGGAIGALNDESLVVIENKAVVVQSVDGNVKFRSKMPKNDIPENWVQSSANGDRFAVSIATWRGGFRALDVSSDRVARRIVVYETATGTELASVAVDPHSTIDLAMSPDGHRIAVLANETVTIADIP
jgi:hypothetical protein